MIKMGIKYFSKLFENFILILVGCDIVVVISIHLLCLKMPTHVYFFIENYPPDSFVINRIIYHFHQILDGELFDYLLVISPLPGPGARSRAPLGHHGPNFER